MSRSSIFAKQATPQETLAIVTYQLKDMIQWVEAEFKALTLKSNLDLTQTWVLHLTCIRKMLDALAMKLATEIANISKQYNLPPEKITYALIEGLRADNSYLAQNLAGVLEKRCSDHHSDESVSQTALKHS